MSRKELTESSLPDHTDEPHMGETAEAEHRAAWVSCPRVQVLLQAEATCEDGAAFRSGATEKGRSISAAFPLKRGFYYPQQGLESFSWCSVIGDERHRAGRLPETQ